MKKLDRRSFCKSALGSTLAAATLGSPALLVRSQSTEANASKRHSIRLGGPVFGAPEDPEELALAHRRLNYRAAYCPNVDLGQRDRIQAISKAFEKHSVVIAEVGRWVNLMDADAEKRKANFKFVTDGLALADEIGALCCVDIAGSFNPTSWFGPHPDNISPRFFDAAVENARKIIDAVKPKRARFCYEMMGWALPDSPDSALKLVQAVDRDAFGVHLDPCNLINCPSRFYDNTGLLNECFDKLGPWIVSCHAKDLTWEIEMNVHFKEVRPGAGSLDYRTFLTRLSQLPTRPPLMLEHLPNAEEYDAARKYLLDLAGKLGVGE